MVLLNYMLKRALPILTLITCTIHNLYIISSSCGRAYKWVFNKNRHFHTQKRIYYAERLYKLYYIVNRYRHTYLQRTLLDKLFRIEDFRSTFLARSAEFISPESFGSFEQIGSLKIRTGPWIPVGDESGTEIVLKYEQIKKNAGTKMLGRNSPLRSVIGKSDCTPM